MTLSDEVVAELSRVTVTRPNARAAEVASYARFAGSMVMRDGGLAFEIAAQPEIARRMSTMIADLYEIHGTYQDSVMLFEGEAARELIRRTGLVTRAAVPVKGLPPHVVAGTIPEIEAALRGAFLAVGSLTEPGRTNSLEFFCPSEESALAVVGLCRRLGMATKTRESRGGERVVIRDTDTIGALLSRMGAQETRINWEERRTRREVRSPVNRLANFDDANLRRSARAAVAAAARVERAIEILGEDVPDHLAEAGRLRVEHRQASLEELGRLADPPMTKDAVAGRIRRLLSMADRRAEELGVADTSSAVTAEMLDEA